MIFSSRLGPISLILGVALPATAQAASVLPLAPPIANGQTYVYALSGDGQVSVGISTNANSDFGAVVWGFGAMPADQGLWIFNSTLESDGQALSNNGLHYGGTTVTGSPVVVRFGLSEGLLDSNGTQNAARSVHGISDDAGIAIGREGTHAAYWVWGGADYSNAQWMASLGGGNDWAWALTPDGTITVGTSRDMGAQTRAVVWSGANFATIQSLDPGGVYGTSGAFAISDDGTTVVGYVNDAGTNVATIWNGMGYGTTTLIAPLGATSSEALAVNADGSIVGGTYEYSAAPGASRAFLYSNGQVGDLGTLLDAAGVDMTGIVLNSVTGLSDSGQYIAANDMSNGNAYLVFYDGTIGGLTTGAAQAASTDAVVRQRQAAAMQPDLYAGIIVGDLQPANGTSEVGAFGLYGSAVGGARASGIIDDNWSLTGGVSLGTGDYGALAYQGAMAAGALRYDAEPFADGFNVFGQVGGSFGLLDPLTFRRDYANGAGTATGIGTTDGYIASVFARLGIRGELSETDQVALSGEIGQRWLSTAAYAEAASASNPFPASFSAATDTATVGKLAASWTHEFTPEFDMTLRGAIGATLAGQTDLAMTTTGFGTMGPAYVGAGWAEAGLRLGWQATEATRFDLYATAMAGDRVGLAGHVGAGLSLSY